MNKTEYINTQKKICRDEWFKDHVASIILGHVGHGLEPSNVQVTVINWKNPKSWNYGCRFIIHRRWLTVVGDIGEAVFEWSEDITLKFLASLDFDYFLSKCRASESGKDFEMWNSKAAISRLQEFLRDGTGTEQKVEDAIADLLPYSGNKHEWCEAIYNGVATFKDYDFALSDAGSVPHTRAIGMFVGLQMAIASFKGNESSP